MAYPLYNTFRAGSRFIVSAIRHVVLDAERAARTDNFIVAATHIGHIEPMVITAIVGRPIRWMTRVEFYRWRWFATLLDGIGAFPVDRTGNAMTPVRTAVRLANAGNCVGVFPEGGVAEGDRSLLRGAPFKHGVCTIAIASRLPILPLVVIGTHRLKSFAPWLPFRERRLWTAFGNDVPPPPRSTSRRADRAEMARRLGAEFVRTYHQLLERCALTDEAVL